MKRLIIDLDNTISFATAGNYREAKPNSDVIDKMHEYSKNGFDIVISTARNMRTYSGNVGKIQVNTVPVIVDWLENHNVPYDELLIGKPWCGRHGFYVDDKAIRPDEFVNFSYDQIRSLLGD